MPLLTAPLAEDGQGSAPNELPGWLQPYLQRYPLGTVSKPGWRTPHSGQISASIPMWRAEGLFYRVTPNGLQISRGHELTESERDTTPRGV
jgi:hypothetical protein